MKGSATDPMTARTTAARRMFACALALAAIVAAADAMAQFGGGMRGSRGGGSRGGGDRGAARDQQQQRQAPAQESGVDMLEQTIEELRVDLRLQPTQVPAWEEYVTKVRLLAGDMARERMQTSPSTQTSALKRIDRSVDAARNRLAALEEISDSAKAFYALLKPEQQTIADPRLAAIVPTAGGAIPAQTPLRSAPPRPAGGGGTP